MKWYYLKDRLALLGAAVACAAAFLLLSLYANGVTWLGPLMTAVSVLALVLEIGRLRKLLHKHGIDPRNRD